MYRIANAKTSKYTILDANRQSDIISLIKKTSSITRKEIAQLLNISEPTVARDLKLLQEISVIKRNGSNKAGYWEVLDYDK